jgi:hypothetical protein
MSRQLSALERRRITGTLNPVDQVAAFSALGIPAQSRNPTGHKIIECVAYTHEVRPYFSAFEWSVIEDEHIDTGLVRQHREPVTGERSGRNQQDLYRQHQGEAPVLDALDA